MELHNLYPSSNIIRHEMKEGTRVERAGRVGDTINACTILVRPEIKEERT
jgi:hypothetical protein